MVMELKPIRKKGTISGSKKANVVLEAIMVLIVLFLFGVLSLYGYKIFTEVNTDLQSDSDLQTVAKTTAGDLHDKYPNILDGAFVTVIVFLWMMVLIASYLIDSHPVFFIIGIILLVIALTLAVFLYNAWEEISTDSTISAMTVHFPMMTYLMNNMVFLILAIGGTVSIVLYSKLRG